MRVRVPVLTAVAVVAAAKPEPWEAAPEEGQGFGRECMRYCLSLTSQERPTHNVCGLKRMAVSKSAILDTDAAMRADIPSPCAVA